MVAKRGTEIKVGIFMMVTLVVTIVMIVMLTSKTQIFKKTFTLHTQFENIAGLIPGAEVRLSGINIGLVELIEFAQEEGKPMVHVTLNVDDNGMQRIMADSKAMIQTAGLLGKKYVEVIPGSAEIGRAEDGGFIESVEPISLTEALDKGGDILDNIGDTAQYLKDFIGSLQGVEGKGSDLARAITHLRNILGEVQSGKGVLHSLIYDKQKTKIVSDLVAAAANIKDVTDEIQSGKGTMHELIYGEKGKDLVANLAQASRRLSDIVGEVKEGKGFLHSLIYEEDKTDLINELKRTAENLRIVSEKIQRGEGTLGALLVDPSIYEDIKKITGDVERSTILKAYIRYTIRKNEADEEEKLDRPESSWGDREG